ncbi:exosome complex component MTR3 [Erpetoichthys calabaricus]|uniref:exosome complex component MTR3 n=1 Tax=Erpetoichthys calabaricus TaxID=27687 RepID=UPI002234BFEC|nr:exosome complex component MTR3 [Erpetoichthys calabaricus]
MPVDTKRLRGPEESQSPWLFVEQEQQSPPDEREDGRRKGQVDVRPIFARCGLVSQAKGSAYIESGKTKVICSVYGPRETERKDETDMKFGRLVCTFRFAPFSCAKRCGWIQSTQEKDLSLALLGSLQPGLCLHRYPRSQIDVSVLVLENDGSALAHAVTCASLALADAGIEMYDLVLGCSLRQEGSDYLLDPTFAEETQEPATESTENRGGMMVALLPSLNQVSGLLCSGDLEQQPLVEAVAACIEGCQRIYSVAQRCLLTAVKKKNPPPDG